MSASFALLGLLEREASYGYELKHEYDRHVGRGRPLPYGQVYSTLSRLARDGKVTVGVVEPGGIDSYVLGGWYKALRRALELGPAGVIREVTDAKLLGRGGAAFPTGRKWDAVAKAPARPH